MVNVHGSKRQFHLLYGRFFNYVRVFFKYFKLNIFILGFSLSHIHIHTSSLCLSNRVFFLKTQSWHAIAVQRIEEETVGPVKVCVCFSIQCNNHFFFLNNFDFDRLVKWTRLP